MQSEDTKKSMDIHIILRQAIKLFFRRIVDVILISIFAYASWRLVFFLSFKSLKFLAYGVNDEENFGLIEGSIVGLILITFVIVPIILGVIFTTFVNSYSGNGLSLLNSFKRSLNRFFPLALVVAVNWFPHSVVIYLLFPFFELLWPLMLMLSAWIALNLAFSIPVVVIEDLGPVEAIKRGLASLSGYRLEVVIPGVLFFFISIGLGFFAFQQNTIFSLWPYWIYLWFSIQCILAWVFLISLAILYCHARDNKSLLDEAPIESCE